MESNKLLPTDLSEKSHLINVESDDEVIINLAPINPLKFDLHQFVFERKGAHGETLPRELFDRITTFLPYYPDFLNFYNTSKKWKKKIAEDTERGQLTFTLENIRPCFLSTCITAIDNIDLKYNKFDFEPIISLTNSLVSAGGGAAAGVYSFFSVYSHRNSMDIFGSFVGGVVGSCVGSFTSSFLNREYVCNIILIPLVSIIGSGVGGGGMLSGLPHGDGADFIVGGLAGAAGGIVGGILPSIGGKWCSIFARNTNAKYLKGLEDQRKAIKNQLMPPKPEPSTGPTL